MLNETFAWWVQIGDLSGVMILPVAGEEFGRPAVGMWDTAGAHKCAFLKEPLQKRDDGVYVGERPDGLAVSLTPLTIEFAKKHPSPEFDFCRKFDERNPLHQGWFEEEFRP